MTAASRTLVVTVLREISWQDSPVCESLRVAGAPLATILFDNGNAILPVSGGNLEASICDGANPGVGPRYLQAARVAEERGDSFLLLLDQDFAAPNGWWQAYESAVAAQSQATCWAPQLSHQAQRISPFSMARGRPQLRPPLPSGLLDASQYVALNSGLLVRTEAVLMAAHELTQAPLDFSDYALFHRIGRAGGALALVDLELQHHLSTFNHAGLASRLSRFAWFCQGARGYSQLDPAYLWPLRRWSLGRAFHLAAQYRSCQFLNVWRQHFWMGVPVGGPK